MSSSSRTPAASPQGVFFPEYSQEVHTTSQVLTMAVVMVHQELSSLYVPRNSKPGTPSTHSHWMWSASLPAFSFAKVYDELFICGCVQGEIVHAPPSRSVDLLPIGWLISTWYGSHHGSVVSIFDGVGRESRVQSCVEGVEERTWQSVT